MQNKGALKLLAIVLAIACAYQLSFTFVTQRVERKAAAYAGGDAAREQAYLDSVKSQTVYNLGFIKFNYKECKEKEINLGLDLRGGMNVMLEIAVEDVVRALSNDSKDPIFNQALAQAREDQKNSTDDYITLFARAYEQLSGGGRLAYIFNTPELREVITANSTNAEVVRVLREQTEGAIENSFNVLRNRIDRFGVTQPNIQRLENSGRILVELPGIKEPERVRKLLQGTASLEFWATYDNTEIYPLLNQANQIIREYREAQKAVAPARAEEVTVEETETVQSGDTTESVELLAQMDQGASDSLKGQEDIAAMYPLYAKMSPIADPQSGQIGQGPVIGHALAADTAAVNAYLGLPAVRAILPRDIKLLWGVKPVDAAGNIFELYAIKANTRDGKAPLDGGVVVEAKEDYQQQAATAEVSMVMNGTGARIWERLTADNVGSCIAIVLDGYVYSAPRVNGAIAGGRSSITGNFTIQEAKDLANVLRSGKLPAPARIIQDTVVGPSLGRESINAGMMSFVIAFVLVLLYMLFFYNTAGLVANIALVTNLFFLFGVLTSFGAVLTLPGLAGIVLTMGMAVDANVIIYERVKEEIKAGKGLSLSIADGFKNAYSAIIDGNVTTLLTGIVLFIFGTGPVQGFATTLIIGIITSLFTAIFITRLIFVAMLEKGVNIRFSNKLTVNFLANTHINFIDKRKFSYIISGALVLVSLVSLFTRGLNYGVDFSGGRAFVVRFDQNVTANQVRSALEEGFAQEEGDDATKSFEVKQFGPENQMRIVTQYMFDDQSQDATAKVEGLLYKSLGSLFVTPVTFEEFATTATNPYGIISADKVGPSVAHDIKVNAIIAVIFSLLAIGLYIVFRFKRWQWGMGSVISLGHDAFLTIGIFSLLHGFMPFNLEVDQSFIAAILTIIGYSINDKVVIFDRIREYQTLYPKMNIKNNINAAINTTLARTMNTSGTTIVVLLAIFLFGGEVIRGFVFALMFGVIVGTYSSVFIATPIAYDMIRRKEAKAVKA
ncbi:protein translocase subunit SecDF [Gallalistipes aquisgranensis]|uniref:protein translocase subunit SecDF n=1 Tax=Gallalistipes aquisgranensis TaxID=2779358 RepID=UPI001CF8B7E5|nr:protein translocase subunit SecDF [Gallalistipes aquisgranensis]MBE5033742.1 protein translocase subunit SecDF [Gallalistipes aquisgranensis]